MVRENVIVCRSELAEHEQQADEVAALKRRICFVIQVVAGILVILVQLTDIGYIRFIFGYGFDSSGHALSRSVVPGLWAGAVCVFVGALHLCWKPKSTNALTISIIIQVSALVVLPVLCFFTMWPLFHRDLRMTWTGYVVVIYSLLLAPMILEVLVLIMTLQSTGLKWLRSQGYLEEGIRNDSFLDPKTNFSM